VCRISKLTIYVLQHVKSMGKKGVSAVLEEEVKNAISVLARATAPSDSKGGTHADEHKHWHLHRKHHTSSSASRLTQQDLTSCKVRCDMAGWIYEMVAVLQPQSVCHACTGSGPHACSRAVRCAI
jgi:hypothetical protein